MSKQEFTTSRTTLISEYAIDYFYEGPKVKGKNQELWLLLHGYGESSYHINKRMREVIPDHVAVLAPNGPYPIPQQTQSAKKLGFAWYFYDREKDQYFIDFSIACSLIQKLIQSLNLEYLPLRIIGYSQGGYLTPFLALQLKQTFHAIGVNSSTRVDFIKKEFHFRFDQINGNEDEFVDPYIAKERFDKLKQFKNMGQFYLLDQETHYFSNGFLPTIKDIISKVAPNT